MIYLYCVGFSLLPITGFLLLPTNMILGIAAMSIGGICLFNAIFSRKRVFKKFTVSAIFIFLVLWLIGASPIPALGTFIEENMRIETSDNISPVPVKEQPKIITYSHTGYVSRCATGQGFTAIGFDDGFVVQLEGNMRYELLPSIGTKIRIDYKFIPERGNILTAMEAVR